MPKVIQAQCLQLWPGNLCSQRISQSMHPIKVDPAKVIRGNFHLKCFLLTIVIYFCLVVLAWCRITSTSSSPSSSSSSSSSSSPTSTATIETPPVTINNGAFHHHHHNHQRQHLRRRHHHHRHHFRRRRRHRRGQTMSGSRLCEEVNICVPLAFLVMLYLVYLVESWHCRLRFELRNATTTRDVYRAVGDASTCPRPQVTWKASGYHYSRKTDYVIKNRGGHVSKRGCYFYYERVNTYKRSATFDYTSLPPHPHHHHHQHQHRHPHCDGCCNDCLACRLNDDVDSMICGDDDDLDSLKTKESFLSSEEELNLYHIHHHHYHHHFPAKTNHDFLDCQISSGEIKTETETASEFSPTNRNNKLSKSKSSPLECVLDMSESLIGLDDFPATRIDISKVFEFETCSVQREYERQKMGFYETCRRLDDFMEFQELLELPGSDVKGNYFAVRNNNRHHHHRHHHRHLLHRFINPFSNRSNWFRVPPISSPAFWFFTFLFLSWPYRLAVELNTARVSLKIRKLFSSNCCCHGYMTTTPTTMTTSNKLQNELVASTDDRKSRHQESGCKRPHPVHSPVNATRKTPSSSKPTRNHQKQINSSRKESTNNNNSATTNPFYRKPPNFSKTTAEGSNVLPSSHKSPQMFVKYRDGSISSEIKSQVNYKTMQHIQSILRPISNSSTKANRISQIYSKVVNKFCSDSTR